MTANQLATESQHHRRTSFSWLIPAVLLNITEETTQQSQGQFSRRLNILAINSDNTDPGLLSSCAFQLLRLFIINLQDQVLSLNQSQPQALQSRWGQPRVRPTPLYTLVVVTEDIKIVIVQKIRLRLYYYHTWPLRDTQIPPRVQMAFLFLRYCIFVVMHICSLSHLPTLWNFITLLRMKTLLR